MADETAVPPPPPGFVPLAASAPPPPPGFVPLEDPGLLESFGRGAAEGATFGFDDKLGFDKERREASRKANPWTHFAGEMIGGILPMVGAGGIGAVAKGAGALSKIGRGVSAAMTPGEINTLGQAAFQGAKLGTTYGGLSGAGHADVKDTDTMSEALTKRAMGAGEGGLLGAAVGPVLGVAGHGVYRGGQWLGGLKALSADETAVHGQGALKTAVRKLEDDRISPDDLITQIRSEFPDDSAAAGIAKRFWGGLNNKQPITGDQVEETVRRAMAGETAADISSALRAANGGNGPGESAVQSLLDELATRHLGPMNLVDRAGLVRRGSGDNTQMTMRAAAATPGEHLGIARESLLERQVGAQGRLQGLFERTLGTSDFDAAAAKQAAELNAAGARMFPAATAEEQAFDLMPIIRNYQMKFDNQRGPVPEGMVKAINSFTTKKPVTEGLTQAGRTEASELPFAERENMLAMWRYANRPISEPQSLSQWAVGYGGLKDPGGDIASFVGGAGPRGLIRQSNGKNLDDAAHRAWEEGFFPGFDRRPTIREFLDALDNDIRGDKVVRPEHFEILESIKQQRDMLSDLSRVGVNARNEVDALKQLGFGTAGRPLVTEAAPQTIQTFIDARQNIRQMIDEAKPGSPLERELTKFYNEITDAVAQANPKWKAANDMWREGKAAQEAMEAGAKMTMRLNSGSRENLAEFTSAQKDAAKAAIELRKAKTAKNPEAIDVAQAKLDGANARSELFKIGLVRALNDMLMNSGETHNLTKQLLLPGAQKMLRQVLGKDADQFFKVIRAEQAMHRTYQSQFGSQTTPLREAVDELNWAPRFEAAWSNLGLGKVLQLAQEYAARHVNSKRNTDLMKLYTETDPIKQLEALRAMQKLHAARSTMGNAVGKPVVAVGSADLPNSLVGLQTSETTKKPKALTPYRP